VNIFWLWPAAALMSFILTGLTMRFAATLSLLDVPNERSSHVVPVPRGGGVAIVLTFAAGMFVAVLLGLADSRMLAAIAGGGGLVALTGLVEDCRGVSVQRRVALQILSAAWALYWLGGIPPNLLPALPVALVQVLGVLGIAWLINLYNFMDGIDGMAGIETVTVCIGGVLLYACCVPESMSWILPALLIAAATGFLFWNFPAARVFLGDTGSGFLGFMMATFCIEAANLDPALFWAWMILLGVFIADSGVTLLRRMLRRQRLHHPHRNHAYQFATRRVGRHAPVTLAAGAINLAWLMPIALLVGTGRAPVLPSLVIAYAPLLWLAFHFKAGAPELQEP
jgi:Fuc2NAc and GlcNAc transferase